MASLVVAGTTIKAALNNADAPITDSVDRARAFDNTYRASIAGTPKQDWSFTTPPTLRATADTWRAILAVVAAQSCSGDILGGTVSCCTEITGWKPMSVRGVQYAVISFVLHQV